MGLKGTKRGYITVPRSTEAAMIFLTSIVDIITLEIFET